MGRPRTRHGWVRPTQAPASRLAPSARGNDVSPDNRKESAPMKEIVGFIGLGNMGLAMATNLLKAGFGLRVYNRTPEKARPLLERGAILAHSPAEAAEPGGVVVTMVSDDRALQEVTLGPDGFLGRLGNGVHLSMSTIAPRTSRRLADLHRERGSRY